MSRMITPAAHARHPPYAPLPSPDPFTLHTMRTHHALESLFTEAEQMHRCVVLPTAAEAKANSRRLETGEIMRVQRGIYARTNYWNTLDPLERTRHIARALAIQHPDWVFCGPTTAILLGLDCSYRLAMPICIVAKPGAHYRNTRSLVHYPIAHPEATTTTDGVRITGWLRTLLDCAARQPLRYSLGPLDSALRLGLTDRDQLLAYPDSVGHIRCRPAVEQAFSLADGRSENGGESEARAVLHEMGCPVSDIQRPFPCLDNPRRTHRPDFLWMRADGGQIAGELDGMRKYVDPSMTGGRSLSTVVDEERDRQRCLERQGVGMVRMYYADLDRPWLLKRRLEAAGVPRAF